MKTSLILLASASLLIPSLHAQTITQINPQFYGSLNLAADEQADPDNPGGIIVTMPKFQLEGGASSLKFLLNEEQLYDGQNFYTNTSGIFSLIGPDITYYSWKLSRDGGLSEFEAMILASWGELRLMHPTNPNKTIRLDTESGKIYIGTDTVLTTAAGDDRYMSKQLVNVHINNSLSVGSSASAIGANSIAVGSNARTNQDGINSAAFGDSAQAFGSNSLAAGSQSQALAANTVAIGERSRANALSSLAIGPFSEATAAYSTAIGHNVNALALRGIAMGYQSTVSSGAPDGISFGTNSTAASANATAIGHWVNASGNSSIVFGFQSYAAPASSHGIAIGSAANTYAVNATAIGHRAYSSAEDSIALGSYAEAKGIGQVVLGLGGYPTGDGANKYNQNSEVLIVGGGIYDGWNTPRNNGANITAKNVLTVKRSGDTTVRGGLWVRALDPQKHDAATTPSGWAPNTTYPALADTPPPAGTTQFDGPVIIKHLVPQGDISMGPFTAAP